MSPLVDMHGSSARVHASGILCLSLTSVPSIPICDDHINNNRPSNEIRIGQRGPLEQPGTADRLHRKAAEDDAFSPSIARSDAAAVRPSSAGAVLLFGLPLDADTSTV